MYTNIDNDLYAKKDYVTDFQEAVKITSNRAMESPEQKPINIDNPPI